MTALAIATTIAARLAWAAARCPLGRALRLGMNSLADAPRGPRG